MFNNKKKPSKIEEKEKEWVPDHKHKQCMFCRKQFSMLNRRHHCRSCGSLVCSDCSKNKWYIESSNTDSKYERVCDVCFDKLSNDRPLVTNSNPHLQVLSEPNFFSWIATFNKSWIRSRYPEQYEQYKKTLLKTSSKSKKTKQTKPSNANIVSKLTPHAIDKKIEANKQKKQLQKQKCIRKHSSDKSDTPNGTNGSKKIYQRPQKQKYQASMEEEKKKQSYPNYPATLQKKKSTIMTKKKKYNPLIVVQTGLLYLNIREAQGLPDCDRFSQPDGYCIYYVTNNDPCFGEAFKYSTKVQHNTYEPKWNEDETIVITNTTGTLVIELWDYDFGPEDDYLGKVEIQLADLFLHFACQQPRHGIIDDWFEVNLAPEWRNQKNKQVEKIERKRKTKTMFNTNNNTVYVNPHSAKLLKQKYTKTSRILQIPNDNDEYDTDNLQLTAVYKRLATMPLLCIDNIFNDEVIKGKCYIHLQLKLKASWWGHFISHFDPLLPPPPKKVPFDVNIFYAELNKILLYVYPIMDKSQSAMDILFWIKYGWAAIYLLMYIYCIFHPWFAVFWFQYRCLTYVCRSYCVQTVLSKDNSLNGSKKFNLATWLHWLVVFFGVIPSIFDTVSNMNQQLRKKEKANKNSEDSSNDESDNELSLQSQQSRKKSSVSEEKVKESNEPQEQDITMGAFTTMMGNKVVRVSGLKDNLGWYQELLVWMNEMIEYILKLFNWTYVSITSVIVITLMTSCLLLIILKETSFYQYELLVIGFGIMAYFSKPIQFMQWLVFGISGWYYQYYCKYTKYKTEINSSEKYDSDFEESDQECEDMTEQSDRKTTLDDAIMTDTAFLKKKEIVIEKDIGIIKQYLYKLLGIIYMLYELCMDLIFGLLEFIKPMFDTERKKFAVPVSKSEPILNRSQTHPAARKRKFKPVLKRSGQMIQSTIDEASPTPVYLSAQALSARNGARKKSRNEVDRILKKQKYSNDSKSKSKMSRFGTMFGFGGNENDGYIQQNNRQNKKLKKKLKKAKTMQRQPTLLRKKTLKEIESAADAGINSMLQKLHRAKSAHDVM